MQSDDWPHVTIPVPENVESSDAEVFESELTALLAARPEAIALDCARIDHFTSMHVKLVWGARTRCAEAGVAVRLKSASKYVWKVLDVLDLAEFFIADDSTEEAKTNSAPVEFMGGLEDYQDSFQADSEGVDRALENFVAYLKTLNIPSSTAYVLRTLFYEVATNIRLHAREAGEAPAGVKFGALPHRDKVVLTFVDDGTAFNPTQFETAEQATMDTAEDRRSLGITILKRLADRMMYRRLDAKRNVLVVERNWRLPQWSQGRLPSAR
jgi:anti-sigma regulatory factor (Ser/Thr protein kinase)/anti-anti-sigma regulatory factor